MLQEGFDTGSEVRGLGMDERGRVAVAHQASVEWWATSGTKVKAWQFEHIAGFACTQSGARFVVTLSLNGNQVRDSFIARSNLEPARESSRPGA